MYMFSIGADDVVTNVGGAKTAHCNGLFPRIKMKKAAYVSLRILLGGSLFKATGEGHVIQELPVYISWHENLLDTEQFS